LHIKKLLCLLALVCVCTACQHGAPAATEEAVPHNAALPSASKPVSREVEASPPIAHDSLSKAMRQLLRRVDLSALLRRDNEDEREHPALDGFFGPNHTRISLLFTFAQRDATHPEIYQVRGKYRHQNNIRPFTGLLTVRKVADLPVPFDFKEFVPDTEGVSEDSVEAQYKRARSAYSTYTLRAHFKLSEDAHANNGLLEGQALLDFYVGPRKETGFIGVAAAGAFTDAPTRGAGMVLTGKRYDTTTNQLRDFVVAGNVFAIASEFYKDFGIGDRGIQLNPKYAKLGWNELWQNDEWWTDSPKPSLHL
jgi:hypothetical protein